MPPPKNPLDCIFPFLHACCQARGSVYSRMPFLSCPRTNQEAELGAECSATVVPILTVELWNSLTWGEALFQRALASSGTELWRVERSLLKSFPAIKLQVPEKGGLGLLVLSMVSTTPCKEPLDYLSMERPAIAERLLTKTTCPIFAS